MALSGLSRLQQLIVVHVKWLKGCCQHFIWKEERAPIKETGWEFSISLSQLNWNWKQTLPAGVLLPLLALNLNVAFSWDSRIRPANSGLAPTTENQEFITWVGPLANNWQHGKAIAPWFPPSPSLLPKLEFALFTQLCRNLLQQEVHAGLSPVAEPVLRERGRDTQNRPRHPLEVVWGSRWVETLTDKWQQSALTYRVN